MRELRKDHKTIKKTVKKTACGWLMGFVMVMAVAAVFCQTIPVQAAAYSAKGFDVSSYNGVIDWDLVADSGMDFVMIRTGEGRAPDVDKQFEANYEGALEAGLQVGVYHVCCVKTPQEAVEEAKYCLKILNGRELDYPVAYDMERPGTFASGRENATAVAKAFCDTIAKAGYEPMIYSQLSYLQTGFDWDELSGYRVWVAAHRDSKPKLDVPVDLWQYTKSGSVKGANTDRGTCDMNNSYMEAMRVRFTQSTLTMNRGETRNAKIRMNPSGCTDSRTFRSSNKRVVTVNKKTGKLTAKAKGRATITVRTGSGQTAKMTVVVK